MWPVSELLYPKNPGVWAAIAVIVGGLLVLGGIAGYLTARGPANEWYMIRIVVLVVGGASLMGLGILGWGRTRSGE